MVPSNRFMPSSFCCSCTATINESTSAARPLSFCQFWERRTLCSLPRFLNTSRTFSVFNSAPSSASTTSAALSPSGASFSASPSSSSFAASLAMELPSCVVMTLSSSFRSFISATSCFKAVSAAANFSVSSASSFKAFEAWMLKNASLSDLEAGSKVRRSFPASVTKTLPSVIMAFFLYLRTLMLSRKALNSSGDTGSNPIASAGIPAYAVLYACSQSNLVDSTSPPSIAWAPSA